MGNLLRPEGIIPVLATAFDADERIDAKGTRRLIRHVLDAGVHGVVVLGSASEFALVTDREKERLVELAVNEVSGQVPVIVGTGESGTRRAIELTQMAERLGADAAIVVPPYYYLLDQGAVIRHYRALLRETGLPLLLYNIPEYTKVALTVETVQALSEETKIVGIKDASADLQYFQKVLMGARSQSFGVIQGVDALLVPSLILGADGSISPAANVAPQWFVQAWGAIHEGDQARAMALHPKIVRLNGALSSGGTLPAGLKGALSLMGICSSVVAAPYEPLVEEEMKRLAAALEEMDLL